jgi:hypothetical protein
MDYDSDEKQDQSNELITLDKPVKEKKNIPQLRKPK